MFKSVLIISLLYGVSAFGQNSKTEAGCLPGNCVSNQGGLSSNVKDLEVESCTAFINSSACEHIPKEDLKVCSSSDPNINLEDFQKLDLAETSTICALESFSSITDMFSFVGSNILEKIQELIGMKDEEEDVSLSLYLNSEFERTYESEEGMPTKRAALAMSQMTSSFFSLLYDAITEEFPCLNEKANVEKVCRYAGGTLVGAGIGAGVAIGLAKIGTLGMVIAGVGGGAYVGYEFASGLISGDPVVRGTGVALGSGTGYVIAKTAGKIVKVTAGVSAGVLGGGLGLFSDEELRENIQRQIRKRIEQTENSSTKNPSSKVQL